MEPYFYQYLKYLVRNCQKPLSVTYTPPASMGDSVRMSSSAHQGPGDAPSLDIHVTSPAFYRLFVHHSHTEEGFDREGLYAEEKNRTVHFSDPKRLALLFQQDKKSKAHASDEQTLGLVEQVRWKVLQSLRCPPANSPVQKQSANVTVTDIRSFPLSGLDRFVQSHCKDAAVYRKTVTKLFLARRFAFGSTSLITVADILYRVGLVFAAYQSMTTITGSKMTDLSKLTSVGVLGLLPNLYQTMAPHAWAFFKGL